MNIKYREWPSHNYILTGPEGQLPEDVVCWRTVPEGTRVLSLAGLTMSLLMEGVWCLCLERDTLPPLMPLEVKGLKTH